MKKIVLLVDFTGVCQLAMEHVAIIAEQCNCLVTLLHIAPESYKHTERDLITKTRNFAGLLEKKGITYEIAIDYGDFFDCISSSINKLNADLIIVGTHAIRGNKQNFVRSNILHLIHLIHIPAIVVQEHSITPRSYSKIIVPILGKPENVALVEPIIKLGSVFNAVVHFVAFHFGDNETQVLSRAKELSSEIAKAGLVIELEPEKVGIDTNLAKSIVEYTDIEDAQIIGLVMSHSDAAEYFSMEDQENILLNRLGKAVLCF